jgi:hypothetical protein
MEFRILQSPDEEWDHFVTQHSKLPFFGSAWGNVLKEGLGGELFHAALVKERRILCALPGVALNYFGFRLHYSLLPYGGFIGDKSLFPKLMEGLLESGGRFDVSYVFPPSPEMDREYARHFRSQETAVTRLELKRSGWNDTEAAFCPSVKQSLNKAKRLNLKVERGRDEKAFAAAYTLYLQSMKRNHAVARYTDRWFQAIRRHLADSGQAVAYLLRHEDAIISATVVVKSAEAYHLMHSGSDTEHLPLRGNDFIVCEIIKDAVNEGKAGVDFMNSDPSDVELIRWKEKFGGQTIRGNNFQMIHHPLKYALWNGTKKILSWMPGVQRTLKRRL